MSQSPGEGEPLAEGTLVSHLLELRDRLLRSVIAVVICFVPLAFFQNELFTLVARPLIDKLPAGTSLIATSVVSPFMAPLKLSLIGAIFLAMPYILFQIWGFVAPGLYKRERRFALPLIVSSIVLFYVGVAFAYYVVFPLMFQFLASTTPTGVKMMTDIANYLDFVLLLFLAFGIAFEMPVAVVLLVVTGLVKLEVLTQNRGYVILGIFIIAAFLTPPDAVSQSFMAVPMYLLYELGIMFARMIQKSRASRRPRPRKLSRPVLGGHPRALSTLFFTEMWERFTFYGMRALLVLFLVDAVESGGYGFDDKTATAIYGLYTAAVFMAALPGGWIADRLIGAQRAVMIGGALMTLGTLMLTIPGPKQLFFGGLVVIILGVGTAQTQRFHARRRPLPRRRRPA